MHTFAQFTEAVDVAFGRWDLDHLRMFVPPDGVEVSRSAWRDGVAVPRPGTAGTPGSTC
ncbi:hypothetical protein [Micromonospora sp. DPT]|uniref:hypothetical protein n=1 Tax=Micromonospora sp. DPT TaxID=3142975 RepID=UPI00320BA759